MKWWEEVKGWVLESWGSMVGWERGGILFLAGFIVGVIVGK
jgi:hypothetical protein